MNHLDLLMVDSHGRQLSLPDATHVPASPVDLSADDSPPPLQTPSPVPSGLRYPTAGEVEEGEWQADNASVMDTKFVLWVRRREDVFGID